MLPPNASFMFLPSQSKYINPAPPTASRRRRRRRQGAPEKSPRWSVVHAWGLRHSPMCLFDTRISVSMSL
jgi:hypothetical protein